MTGLIEQGEAIDQKRDWAKSMSDHVAYALLVYTALQILVTVKAISASFSSILPYFALVALVGGMIPACRWFEKRWNSQSDERADDVALIAAFRRDVVGLWILAICFPLALTFLVKVLFALI